MKTAAEQIREVCEDVNVGESVGSILERFNALADHLESEPSGGLREAAQQACDYYFQENGQIAYVMGKHDENMRALRVELSSTPKPPESAERSDELQDILSEAHGMACKHWREEGCEPCGKIAERIEAFTRPASGKE